MAVFAAYPEGFEQNTVVVSILQGEDHAQDLSPPPRRAAPDARCEEKKVVSSPATVFLLPPPMRGRVAGTPAGWGVNVEGLRTSFFFYG